MTVVYPHRLRLWRPSEGGSYEGGAWTPAPDLVLYDGPADVQDVGREVQRAADNSPVVRSDAVAYLPEGTPLPPVRSDDRAEVVWRDGDRSSARVMKPVRLDAAVHLAFVEEPVEDPEEGAP